MPEPIVVLGATGLFGGHLARALLTEGHEVVLSGRSRARLDAFALRHGGRVRAFDRDDPAAVAQALAEVRAGVVIDAAGPFQFYGADPYRFARQVIAAGAHYLDLADAPGFVGGIGVLDAEARRRGVSVLSGASSTPALAAAVADVLTAGLEHVEAIETAILPGNRTERGLSVTEAILGQVGQPFEVLLGGRAGRVHGWDATRRIRFGAGGRTLTRRGAFNQTPDLILFPERYAARTVIFRAGLELAPMHFGLSALRWLVRLGVVRSLRPLAHPLHRLAGWLRHIGSDSGGMIVEVTGCDERGWVRRRWCLVASDGEGPRIPGTPAALVAARMLAGRVAPGARPCMGEVPLANLEDAMAGFGVICERSEARLVPVFEQVLGAATIAQLDPPVAKLHGALGLRRWRGEAEVEGPQGLLGGIAARVAGFRRKAGRCAVEVTIDATEAREVWTRDFDGHRFHSVLTPHGEVMEERFGPFTALMPLAPEGGALTYPVAGARAFGLIPLPRMLIPVSRTREWGDDEGRFRFEVEVSLPSGARIGHYRGWLVPGD